jgi:ribose transport system substrate-binding protein
MNKLRIVVALITQDNDFQQEQASVAAATARKFGMDASIIYADNDGVNQSLQLVQIIQAAKDSHPDAIVVEPVGTTMPQVAQAAAAAGIGWVVLNRHVDYLSTLRRKNSAPMFSVSTNNRGVGQIQGEQFNALVPPGGAILYLEGPSLSDTAQDRRLGMLETKREDIAVKTLRGDWTENSAYQALKSWLRLPTSKELNVRVIGCQNDAMAIGARKAIEDHDNLEEREKLLRLPFTGCDGIPTKGQSFVHQGLLKATIVTPPLTARALEMLAAALQSGKLPPEDTLVEPDSYPAVSKLRS